MKIHLRLEELASDNAANNLFSLIENMLDVLPNTDPTLRNKIKHKILETLEESLIDFFDEMLVIEILDNDEIKIKLSKNFSA